MMTRILLAESIPFVRARDYVVLDSPYDDKKAPRRVRFNTPDDTKVGVVVNELAVKSRIDSSKQLH